MQACIFNRPVHSRLRCDFKSRSGRETLPMKIEASFWEEMVLRPLPKDTSHRNQNRLVLELDRSKAVQSCTTCSWSAMQSDIQCL